MARKEQIAIPILGTNLQIRTISLVAVVMIATIIIATPVAQAQTLTVIHAFTGGGDGDFPGPSLVMDRTGNLYGTTFFSGFNSGGGVFELVQRGSGWVLNPLVNFSGTEGSYTNNVIVGPDGNLYGTNPNGGGVGSCDYEGCGTVFELTPPVTRCGSAVCPWSLTILYRFTGQADGGNPAGVIFDQVGNLYGTTFYGGNMTGQCAPYGCGVVYKLSPSNGGWTETVLYAFNGGTNDGANPPEDVIFDSSGNLYSMTTFGGTEGAGTVFKLTPSGSGWTESVLHNFGNGSDGKYPSSALILDGSGNFYGTTQGGGNDGLGTVYSLSPSGSGWTEAVLYSFNGSYGDEYPQFGRLFLDAPGNLYGTTPGNDGSSPYGNVFQMTPSNGGWSYSSLHSFTGGSDGGTPYSTVVMDASGNLYGTAYQGGYTNNDLCQFVGCGVVWKITR